MRSIASTAILGLTVLVAVSRGILETYVGKNLAYVGQAVGLTLGLLFLLVVAQPARRATAGRVTLVTYLYMTTILISAILTTLRNPELSPMVYVGTSLFFCFFLYVTASFTFVGMQGVRIEWVVFPAVLGLIGVALAQQFGSSVYAEVGSTTATFDGGVRPPSITGSYLHYPLAAALLFFITVQVAASRHRLGQWLIAGAVGIAVISSYSRSGVLVLAAGLVVASFLAVPKSRQSRATRFLTVSVLIAACGAALSGTSYGDRIGSAISLSSSGNEDRVTRWVYGLDLWSSSPVLFGDVTGAVTNSTANFGGPTFGVVESSLLQQLINFGLFGAFAFYVLLIFLVRSIDRSHLWLRAGAIGAIFQTLVYQSIEVIPFMFLLAIYPIISISLSAPSRTSEEDAPAAGLRVA